MNYLERLFRDLNLTAMMEVSDERRNEIRAMYLSGAKPLRIYCHFINLLWGEWDVQGQKELAGIEAHLIHSYGLDRGICERFAQELLFFNGNLKKGHVANGSEADGGFTGDFGRCG